MPSKIQISSSVSAPHERTIITAALPYANGDLHIGHMVEYTQADIYVRALNALGDKAHYICANDAHGTPIEVNAGKLGITPERLVADVHDAHKRDFAAFGIRFDYFGITHSDTNKRIVHSVYERLKQGGNIDEREVEGNWCEHDQRFLPDRFVRGTCPNTKCGAVDQYGDVCEVCRSTHAPTELKEARCVLCGNPPVTKVSTHLFFKLSKSDHVDFLRQWIDSGALQEDQANYVRSWLDKGLQDWCISRDGPYFGFEVPDRPGKYFYVWLDAPLGYIAASLDWGEQHQLNEEILWRSEKTRIEHIIGKDIVYFHTLFWPAVLRAAGYSLPSGVHVHGMLTVGGVKMSKSLGTFIKAKVFAEHIDPQALRFYFATKYGAGTDDLDLSFEDLLLKTNSELVNKHANLFSRSIQFVHKKLEGRLGHLHFSPAELQAEVGAGEEEGQESKKQQGENKAEMLLLAKQVMTLTTNIERCYRQREFGQVMRDLAAIADIGNEYMQGQAPWSQLKVDVEQARTTCTFVVNVCHVIARYIYPVLPEFSEAASRMLKVRVGAFCYPDEPLFALHDTYLGPMERLFERIDATQISAIVEASKENLASS